MMTVKQAQAEYQALQASLAEAKQRHAVLSERFDITQQELSAAEQALSEVDSRKKSLLVGVVEELASESELEQVRDEAKKLSYLVEDKQELLSAMQLGLDRVTVEITALEKQVPGAKQHLWTAIRDEIADKIRSKQADELYDYLAVSTRCGGGRDSLNQLLSFNIEDNRVRVERFETEYFA